jgi:hypothetical protein
MKGFYIALVFIKFLLVRGQNDCPTKMDPCQCFATTGQIRCVGRENISLPLTIDQLKMIGNELEGKWHSLHIENTSIANLNEAIFQKANFKKLFIIQNQNLSQVTAAIFVNNLDYTDDIVIKNNNKLTKVDGALLNKNKNSLANLELDNNDIRLIESNYLQGFNNLVNISITNQVKPVNLSNYGIDIKPGAFNNLPNLRFLNLDGNIIKPMANLTIDLHTVTMKANETLLITLNDTNLDDSFLVSSAIKLPNKLENGSIVVDLTNNKFTKLIDGIIVDIAKIGYVYIDTAKLNCECKDIKNLKEILNNNTSKYHIQTIRPTHDCITTTSETVEINSINCV